MDIDIIFYLISILLALSGWGKVWFDHQSRKPKIVGRVLGSMVGYVKRYLPTADFVGPLNDIDHTTFTLFIYLLNERNNFMHILDYKLRIKVDNTWIKVNRVYNIAEGFGQNFYDANGNKIEINNFYDNLIYNKKLPTQQGIPLHGWMMFDIPRIFKHGVVDEYELTCIDANLKKHIINTKVNELQNVELLQEIAGMKIPYLYI